MMRALVVMVAVMVAAVVRGDPSDSGVSLVSRDRPGTLLLNMLIKNEAFHLERSLPKWAPLIDYWIIGVDDKNTDNSEEIIHKYLGHIPGQTVGSFLLSLSLSHCLRTFAGSVAHSCAHGIVTICVFRGRRW